jgi:hypothetical protein
MCLRLRLIDGANSSHAEALYDPSTFIAAHNEYAR